MHLTFLTNDNIKQGWQGIKSFQDKSTKPWNRHVEQKCFYSRHQWRVSHGDFKIFSFQLCFPEGYFIVLHLLSPFFSSQKLSQTGKLIFNGKTSCRHLAIGRHLAWISYRRILVGKFYFQLKSGFRIFANCGCDEVSCYHPF